ncbi:MAG TPA: hypothetical protein VFB68_10945 [Xanthobacteraceae bacterium]|nr:hypothetical protein [Xanthobacteraceae bacterium]
MTAAAADMPVKAQRVVEQPQQVSGYVELYGGWARTKETICGTITCFTDDPANGWALGGAGRATWWWAPNYSLQLDAQGEGTSYKFNNGPNNFIRASAHSYLIGGHANWRDPSRGLIGIFGGAGDATNYLNFSSVRHGLIGAEGQLYWGPVTLYGQGGYQSTLGSLSSFNLDSIQAWFVRGTARVYATPNFRIEGTVLYADGDVDFAGPAAPVNSVDFETWLWRAKAEYKFTTSPFSIFAVYEGSRTTADRVFATGTTRVTDNRILGGIRLYLNENTLQWNDRNGTTLDIIAPFSAPSFIFPSTQIN